MCSGIHLHRTEHRMIEKLMKRLIKMGWTAFGIQHNVKNNLPPSLKGKLYYQWILPVLTYGSETWSITKVLEQKLQSGQKEMEVMMFGITLRDRKRAP